MASMDEVNRQHIAAAGLDPDSLGQARDPEPERCPAKHPTQHWLRCQKPAGHSGYHQRTGKRPGSTPLNWPPGAPQAEPEVPDEVAKYLEPTKQREGDQRLPDTRDGQVCVQDLVIAAMEESKRVGTERYGQPLMTFNGRRTIRDVTEEARDLMVYLTQVQAEVDASRDDLVTVAKSVIAEKIYQSPLTTNHTFSVQQFSEHIAGAVVDRLLGHFTEPPRPDRDEVVAKYLAVRVQESGMAWPDAGLIDRWSADAALAYDVIFGS